MFSTVIFLFTYNPEGQQSSQSSKATLQVLILRQLSWRQLPAFVRFEPYACLLQATVVALR